MVVQYVRGSLRSLSVVALSLMGGWVPQQPMTSESQLGDDARVDETLDWNEHLIDALFTAGTTPPPSLRIAAIMNIAMFDAANLIHRRFTPIHFDLDAPDGASRRAARVGAAYTVLSKLFPSQQAKWDAARTASLAALTDDEDDDGSGQQIATGLAWGATAANDVLAWRATDGFTATFPPFNGGTAVGQWRPTPPAFQPMVQMQFAFMTPFMVTSLDQFVAPKPRGLNSDAWVSDYNEVKVIASKTGSPRTDDQTSIAWFWAGVGWAHWSEALHGLAVNNRTGREETSRIFAQLATAGADTIMTTWHGKRMYAADPTAVTWRPITAIRLGGDGNPATPADPAWTPLIPTQPHPEYVPAHPSFNGCAAAMLQAYYGGDESDQSFTLSYPVAPSTAFGALPPGVTPTRRFTSIAQAEAEANNARIYGGLHYRSSNDAADLEGRTITKFYLANVATPAQLGHHDVDPGQRDHNHGNGDCRGDGESAAATTDP
jgi:hypothetical protein